MNSAATQTLAEWLDKMGRLGVTVFSGDLSSRGTSASPAGRRHAVYIRVAT